MPIPLFNQLSAGRSAGAKFKIPKLVLPDLGRFVTAEAPAIALQMAPALEDLAALTDGIPADLGAQIESLLAAQASGAIPGAAVIAATVGDAPDYALLRTDPEDLDTAGKRRQQEEVGKLLGRRQNYGIYFGPEGKGGLQGRKKGTGTINLSLDVLPLLDKSGAPFAVRVETEGLTAAANAVIEAEKPHYGLDGGECHCGPVEVTSLAIQSPSPGMLETVVSGKIDLLLGALHSGFQLRVTETLGTEGNPGRLEDPKAAARVEVLQIVGANLPDKVKKALDRDVVQRLLVQIAPVGVLVQLALRALASHIATKKANEGEEIRGPVHDALEAALAPQLIRATDQKLAFDIQRASTPTGAIAVSGVVLVHEREQNVRIGALATGRRVGDSTSKVFDVQFRAIPTDMAEPVRYTWQCLGETQTGGPTVTFRVDTAVNPEFAVGVSAEDAEGFHVPAKPVFEIRNRFRAMPGIPGHPVFLGVPEPKTVAPVRP